MDVVTSSVTHDMITPLKSVSCLSIQLCRKVEVNEMKGVQKNLLLIYSTTQMILSGVKLLLDKRMLDKNNFLFQISEMENERRLGARDREAERSQFERRIAVELLHARHEKDVIRENRIVKEREILLKREKEFQDALDKERVKK